VSYSEINRARLWRSIIKTYEQTEVAAIRCTPAMAAGVEKIRMDCSRFSGDDRGVTERIEKGVELAGECTARDARSELVVESFQEQIVWERTVGGFALIGHPEVKCAGCDCEW
jgi:hypothetical protein